MRTLAVINCGINKLDFDESELQFAKRLRYSRAVVKQHNERSDCNVSAGNMKSFGAIRESEGTYKAYKVVVRFTVKGALRSFGKTFFFPLKGNATSNCLASFMCGGPCHLSHFKQSSGDFTVLFYSEMKNY